MSGALIIFAKQPVAGQAKTRLAPVLGDAGAAALAQRLLEHTVQQAAGAGFDHVELCTAPDTSHPAFTRLATTFGLTLATQGDGDLGQRMARALARMLDRHSRAVLIGTDAPALDPESLARAALCLHDHDAVFIPALDGGYALVGLRRPAPMLFQDVSWSTAEVMAQTRERARAAGLTWVELAPVADIDVPADLAHLPPDWQA
jgi:rSAM/selenodomain-associated transferase 1